MRWGPLASFNGHLEAHSPGADAAGALSAAGAVSPARLAEDRRAGSAIIGSGDFAREDGAGTLAREPPAGHAGPDRPVSGDGVRRAPPGIVFVGGGCRGSVADSQRGAGEDADVDGGRDDVRESQGDAGAGSPRWYPAGSGTRRAEGRALVGRLATRKFGAQTAEQLSRILEDIADPEQLAEVADAIMDCDSDAELFARVGV